MNEMDNENTKLLIETSERSKSNTHQIEEIKEDVKEIKSEQKAIYDIATSVKLIALSMDTMKDDLAEVKQGQVDLSNKVDNQITEVKNGQATLENKIWDKVDAVNDKVENVDDKTKVDWARFFTSNILPWVVCAITFIYTLLNK